MSASAIIADFEKKSGRGWWPHITRQDVAQGLRDRLRDPGKIHQGPTPFCGPASLLFCVLRYYPQDYVQYIVDLYDTGSGDLWGLHVEASQGVRDYAGPWGTPIYGSKKIAAVDWIGLGTLRDSENMFRSVSNIGTSSGKWYQDPLGTLGKLWHGAAGITLPSTLADWFKRAQYPSVKNVTNLGHGSSPMGVQDIEQVADLWLQDYDICFLINSQMLYASDQESRSMVPSHWVVLNSFPDVAGGNIRMKVFSWGDGQYLVPQGAALPIESFLGNFHGYVAAR